MTDEEFKRHAEECKRALEYPEPPDDPDAENDFEEWTYVNEHGQRITFWRPNRKRLKKIVSDESIGD